MINRKTLKIFSIMAGPMACFIVMILFKSEPNTSVVGRMAAVTVWMAIWWITEVVPLAVTSLLPVVLFPVFGIMSGKTVSPIYFNHIVFLFIGGFFVALAMQRWNLHRRIALRTLSICGKTPARILLGIMSVTGFLSMWISNTAATMMMVPIVAAMITSMDEKFGQKRVIRFSKSIFLAVAYSSSIGGIATLVGTPPNMAFTQIFSKSFPDAPEISFASWIAFAFPLSLIFLFIVWGILSYMCSYKTDKIELSEEFVKNKLKEQKPPSYEEKVVLTAFISLAFLWITRSDLNIGIFTIPGWSRIFNEEFINDGTVAITVAILLFLIPSKTSEGSHILDWKTAEDMPWDIVLLFGGGFALAEGFRISGLSLWIGNKMAVFMNHPTIMIVAIVCLIMTFLTEFTSNTATAIMVLPILAGLSVSLKINPLILMIPATLSCSFAFMLPIATPPNAIVFSTRCLKISDMAKAGILLNIIGVILTTLYIYYISGYLLGIDLKTFPVWAR